MRESIHPLPGEGVFYLQCVQETEPYFFKVSVELIVKLTRSTETFLDKALIKVRNCLLLLKIFREDK